jgi:predicted nucleic acid-binding protein
MIDSTPIVYVDANPFIYAIEGENDISRRLNDLFAVFRQYPGMAVTSELTLAEVLPKARSADLQVAYAELIIWSGIFELKPVTRQLLLMTAEYRRASAIVSRDGRKAMPRLPDAIHVVTATQSGCTAILSTDARLKLPTNIQPFEASEQGIAAYCAK